ncbi:hypothetical protein MASR2M39_13640 [Ignavibacteriales bacterium]
MVSRNLTVLIGFYLTRQIQGCPGGGNRRHRSNRYQVDRDWCWFREVDGTNWTVYNTTNSGLPANYVNSIAIDQIGNKWIRTCWFRESLTVQIGLFITPQADYRITGVQSIAIDQIGTKWIGTGAGFVKFDGTNWTVYNTTNSGLPANYVNSIAIDQIGNKWIGTDAGFVKFDGTNWTVYNTTNSGLPNNSVLSITIDQSGTKWIGTSGGLAKFDGTNWTVYNTTNSGLPSNFVVSIAIDQIGNRWIATSGGLAKFDGTNWTVYNVINSGLPFETPKKIAIDQSDNKWIVSYYDLTVYREGGVILAVDDEIPAFLPKRHQLSQNYPNPFNPTTVIRYELPNAGFVSLIICDNLGRFVRSLVNEEQLSGKHEINFNASDLSSGIYFYTLRTGDFTETKKLVLLK